MGYQRTLVGDSEFVRLSRYGRGHAASDIYWYVLRAPNPADLGVFSTDDGDYVKEDIGLEIDLDTVIAGGP